MLGRGRYAPPARSSHASGRARRGLEQSWVVAMAGVAVAVGALTAIQPGVAAMIAGVSLLPAALTVIGSQTAPADMDGKSFRWLSYAWVFLLLRPIGDYSQDRGALAAASGQADLANLLEVGTYALVGAAAIVALRRNGLARRPPWLLLVLPTLTLLSTAWSLAPVITFAFAFEMFVVVLVATLTTAIFITDAAVGRSVVRRFLRLTVILVAVLSMIGLAVGDAGLGPTAIGDRFRWPGVHPIVASIDIGFAFLVLVFARREAGFSLPVTAALLGVFSVCLYESQTRTALIGLSFALAIGYWIATRRRPMTPRLAGGAAIAVAVALLVTQYGGGITTYLYRGEPNQQVSSLNGRLPLWELGIQKIGTPDRWLAGHGVGGTRVLFATSSTWAGEAHSAWLELLLSLGLIGIAAGVLVVVVVGVRLFRGPVESAILPVLFVFLLAVSPVGSGFGIPGPEPGLGFGLLALAFAARAAPRRAEEAVSRRRPRVQGHVRSVATSYTN